MAAAHSFDSPKGRIIVALDVPTAAQALKLVDRLSGQVGLFKVGLQLFTAEGPSVVREVIGRGGRVFLDLKLHDIPNTVASAAAEAAGLGVSMLTVHASGGYEMMARTAERVAEFAEKEGREGPLLLGVTVLTSLDEHGLVGIGVQRTLREQVRELGRDAVRAGFGGVVCSAREIALLRQGGLKRTVLVTPGIRPAGASRDDQARVLTPAQAVAKGADYLVIGRPITQAEDPSEAAAKIADELATPQE